MAVQETKDFYTTFLKDISLYPSDLEPLSLQSTELTPILHHDMTPLQEYTHNSALSADITDLASIFFARTCLYRTIRR